MEKQDISKLIDLGLPELFRLAGEERKRSVGSCVELCSIVNAKSGACSENCKFCAQSAHNSAEIAVYPLLDREKILAAAKKAADNGATRFGIVTSGRKLMKSDIARVCDHVRAIRKELPISVCASLGSIDLEDMKLLKEAGVTRYHHNVETSGRFYSSIVTTHKYSERTNTVKNAKKAGLEVCSGGIIGLGESWTDRVEMALTLKRLEVDSVPLNVYIPLKGTALENIDPVKPEDILKTITLFRILLPGKTIRMAAGKENVCSYFSEKGIPGEVKHEYAKYGIDDPGTLLFMAGVNAIMIGGYLTVAARSPEKDGKLARAVSETWKKE